jgi:hypothetical protein
MCLLGNALQLHSHLLLARLAAGRGAGRMGSPRKSPGPKTYKIPRGGAFEWVSCPHYLAEIVIYLGLVLVQGGRAILWLVLAWVVRGAAGEHMAVQTGTQCTAVI